MKKVKVEDLSGKVVMRFDSIRDAAHYFGVEIATLSSGIRRGMLRNDMRVLFDEDESKPKRVPRIKKPVNDEADLDRMSADQLDREEQRLIEKGVKVERLTYQLHLGLVNITVCRKKERGITDSPKVGGLECVKCRYFRGRCRDNKTVLCIHRHATTGGIFGIKGKRIVV